MLQILALALPGLLIAYSVGTLINDNSEDRDDEYVGADGDDTIDAGTGDDLIAGLGGDDILLGGSGNDIIDAGPGNDIVQGQQDNDTILGAGGNDYIQGGDGNDDIAGDDGDDWLEGQDGEDAIMGGIGDDIVIGGQESDTLSGGAGADLMVGGLALGGTADLDDLIFIRNGGSPADALGTEPDAALNLREDGDADTLDGGDGEDILILGSADTATGGEGNDIFALLEDIGTDGPAVITDFNPAEDGLVILVRDINATLDLSVTDQGDDALIFNGDMLLGRVTGGAAQVAVTDLSIVAQAALTIPTANNV